MLQDGVQLDNEILVQVLQNQLASLTIRAAQLEAALQSALVDKQKAEMAQEAIVQAAHEADVEVVDG